MVMSVLSNSIFQFAGSAAIIFLRRINRSIDVAEYFNNRWWFPIRVATFWRGKHLLRSIPPQSERLLHLERMPHPEAQLTGVCSQVYGSKAQARLVTPSAAKSACMLRQCEPSQNTRWQTLHVLKRWKRARTIGGNRSSTSILLTLRNGALQCRQSVKGRALRDRSRRSKTSVNCCVDLSART